jgi:hypothetical protein
MVLLCLPLWYDSPVSTFVAHVDGMDRSSDQMVGVILSSIHERQMRQRQHQQQLQQQEQQQKMAQQGLLQPRHVRGRARTAAENALLATSRAERERLAPRRAPSTLGARCGAPARIGRIPHRRHEAEREEERKKEKRPRPPKSNQVKSSQVKSSEDPKICPWQFLSFFAQGGKPAPIGGSHPLGRFPKQFGAGLPNLNESSQVKSLVFLVLT